MAGSSQARCTRLAAVALAVRFVAGAGNGKVPGVALAPFQFVGSWPYTVCVLMRVSEGPVPSGVVGQGATSSYSTSSTNRYGIVMSGSGALGRASRIVSPPLSNTPPLSNPA